MISTKLTIRKPLCFFLCLLLFIGFAKANNDNLSKLNSEDKISTSFIASNDTLYFLCDGGDRLYEMNRSNNAITYLGSTSGGSSIEAIAYNPFNDQLYGTNGGTFVHINKTDGTVTSIADVDGSTDLDGSEGGISANDIDGLEFDTWGGFYWASARRSGVFDALFKIDATTGLAIRDAFGPDIDYIIIDGVGVNVDIDDIAIDPISGKLYAVTTVSGSSKLIEVNRFTGAILSSTVMDEPDAEGLGFSSDGVLYATIGTEDEMWVVATDGTMTSMVDLSDGGDCSDVEAVTATTAPADTIGGTVWNDVNMDQSIGAESGISGVTVNLYYDTNGDGDFDAGDVIIQTATTDANGDYGFMFGTNADLLLAIDGSTLPAGYALTTDNIEIVSFTNVDNEEQDYNNNFGATSGADCDGDGIPDFSEGTADSDGDSINNDCDLDSDNDGIPDAEEGMVDTDGDGILDLVDRDSDNDGIPDAIEANNGLGPTGYDSTTGNIVGTDGDSDGLLDSVDDIPATPYAGSTTTLPITDHDDDGVNDFLDLDADNDGILDIVEAGGIDTDLDGMVDSPLDSDINTDGYADALTTTPLPIDNTGANGNPNYIDIDSDDDGLDDTLEGLTAVGYTAPSVILDIDNNGIIDFWDSSLGGNPIVPVDTDDDVVPDCEDLDSDNDGIPDIVEAGGVDTDGNGMVDALNPDGTLQNDTDNDGLADVYDSDNSGTKIPNPDTDNDGIVDAIDLDADNDGIPDLIEAGGLDPDNDGMVDTGLSPWDADADGLADVYDETVVGGVALVETTGDTNNDGIVNNGEKMIGGASNIVNVDDDVNPNHLDLDADNDGITDVVENSSGDPDTDNGSGGAMDGKVDNYTDTADTNGWNDTSNSSTTDTDSDDIPDYLDIDADNDGIVDYLEGVCSTCPTFNTPSGADTDSDGVLDIYEEMSTDNTDNTTGTHTGATPNEDDDSVNSVPDYLDVDSDNDTAKDWVEGYDVNDNGDASDDIISMAAAYEMATSKGYYNTTDTDSDGLPDWLDNQPAVSGYDPLVRPPFLNPASPSWHDDDKDGLVDIFDTSEGGTNAPTPDNNSADDLDWRDNSITSALPVELSVFRGKADNCNVELYWKAETEEAFSHYELEWSGDGQGFQMIERIEGAGDLSTSQAYKYFDEGASRYNYYRLKMVDMDGTIDYSYVVFIETECDAEFDMIAYPNPISTITNTLSVRFYSEREETTFILVNITGQVVRRLNINVEKEWNTVRLDITGLPIGSYFIKQPGIRGAISIIIQE